MAIDLDLQLFDVRLRSAIKSILETDLAEEIKTEVSNNIEKYTFTMSRGPSGMGVRDKRNFEPKVLFSGDYSAVSALGLEDTYILRVTDVAKFQSSAKRDKSLAEVVEEGDPRYNIYAPRPFIAPTQMIMDYGVAEAVVADGLRKRGFVVR